MKIVIKSSFVFDVFVLFYIFCDVLCFRLRIINPRLFLPFIVVRCVFVLFVFLLFVVVFFVFVFVV